MRTTPVLLLLLAACGPVMGTATSYTPPSTSEGMACVSTCGQARDRCVSTYLTACTSGAQQQYQACQVQAALQQSSCLMARGLSQTPCVAPRCTYGGGYCAAQAQSSCAVEHDSCYVGCGGQTHVNPVCTRRCG